MTKRHGEIRAAIVSKYIIFIILIGCNGKTDVI